MTTAATKQPAKSTIRNDVVDLINLIEAFGTLLVHETEALKKADFKTVDTLQADKKSLARQYGDQVQLLSDRRSEMASVDTDTRKKLLSVRADFSTVLDENLRALNAAKNSAKRLVDRILEVARKTVVDEKHTSYSAKGHTAAYKTATLSLSLDRKL